MKQQFNYVLINKRNICFILENLILFCFWVTFSWTSVQISAVIDKVVSMLFSQRWSNAEHMLIQLSFPTRYQRWNDIGSSTLNLRNSFNVVSTLFCQRWNNVDKHMSAQLSISTKFQCWSNIGSSTLNQRNFIDVASTLFCQRWNNVDKCTSAKLSFSTKYQRWCICWVFFNCKKFIYGTSEDCIGLCNSHYWSSYFTISNR